MTSFRILHVCTGNVCRSPMAERITAAVLSRRLGATADRFVVASAGTWGHEGSPMEPYAEDALRAMGVDPSGFRARELLSEHVRGADLVLAATREHLAHVVAEDPGALRRTFTLLEFARIAAVVGRVQRLGASSGDDLADRARELVDRAAAARSSLPPIAAADDDVPDPYGAPLAAFRACAAQIAEAVTLAVQVIAAPTAVDQAG